MAVIAYADGPTSGRTSPWDLADMCGIDDRVEVIMGWEPLPPAWLDDPRLRGTALMGGYGLARAIESGRVAYLPVRLGSVPKLLAASGIDVAVVPGVRRGSGYAYRGAVGWGPAAVKVARFVVVEVDERAVDLGAPTIDAIPDHVIDLPAREPAPVPVRATDTVDEAIAANVLSLLPDDPALQFGPGGIGEAVVGALDRPARILSGLLTESMAALHRRGLLSGAAVAAYVSGGPDTDELGRAGRLDLRPVEVTHDVGLLASTERFVACNTALQVALDGSVNVERVGSRLVAGIGGHADFSAGASRSAGGLSIIALRSTTRSGRSTIVERVDVVSTPRCDVDVVVTEHGVADLRGLDDAHRAEAIVGVAAPASRDELGRVI